MCANVLAVAPEARVVPYRATDDFGALVAPLAAFMRAKADKPDVITCSWGAELMGPLPASPRGMDRAMVLEILDAIDQGIVVVFAAGNGGHSIEAQVPGVISAGAAYVNEELAVIASDVGSAYRSLWQPDVTVPTVCGLVGMRPRGQYILLPVAPTRMIDVGSSRPEERDGQLVAGDGTKPGDGWALLSGTSVAAPQVAGAAAVLLSAKPDLTPEEIAKHLGDTAIDIRAGRCHPMFAYAAGDPTELSDIPTGHGLINVSAAVDRALTPLH
jgi:subtilisin family serine protease